MVAVAAEQITVTQDLYPQQFAFLHDHRRYPAFIGGRNCVAPETLIDGIPIAELTDSFEVRTLTGVATASPSFRKGRANLYRVRTQSGGSVVATLGHRVLTPIGWRPLGNLSVGDAIAGDGNESARSACGIAQGSMDHYSAGSHPHDELSSPAELVAQGRWPQLHTTDDDTTPLAIYRLSSLDASHLTPRQYDVSRHEFEAFVESLQGLHQSLVPTPASSHPQDSEPQLRPSGVDAQGYAQSFQFESLAPEESSRLLTATYPVAPRRHVDFQVPDMFQGLIDSHDGVDISCVDYTTFWDYIVAIEFVRYGDFYDIQVPNAHHYPAGGIWHHNSGKTFTGAYKAFERMNRGGLGLVAGPSFPQMKLGPKPRLLSVLDAAGISYVENKNENTLYVPGLNAGVQFAGLENDTYTRGPNYGWGWIDELDFVANPEMYKTAKASVREGDDYQLFSTSTPKGQYIIYREWVLEHDDFHKLYKASTYDNFFVDAASFVAGLGYVGSFYEQEINADFVKLEGLVYPAFDRLRQVRVVDVDDWPAALGLDIGARSPTALMTMRYSGDRFHIERELYQREMGNPEIVDAVCDEYERTNALFVVVDPEAANLVLDLQRKGLHVRKAQKAVKDGITRVTGIIPELTIDPACVNTLAEIESYQYPPNGEKDQPIKANDHLMDDLRYLAMELTKPRKKFRVY